MAAPKEQWPLTKGEGWVGGVMAAPKKRWLHPKDGGVGRGGGWPKAASASRTCASRTHPTSATQITPNKYATHNTLITDTAKEYSSPVGPKTEY